MQIAIDNAKRSYDIDLVKEIARLKGEMDLRTNGVPIFFDEIRKRNAKKMFKNYTHEESSKGVSVNHSLICPMNYLKTLKFKKFPSKESTIPMEFFFVNKGYEAPRKTSKKVEELIEKYSLELFEYNTGYSDNDLLLREDFDNLIEDIRRTNISKSYVGVMSHLINRAFFVTPAMKTNRKTIQTKVNKNKSLLMKVLFEVNKNALLSVFAKKNYEYPK